MPNKIKKKKKAARNKQTKIQSNEMKAESNDHGNELTSGTEKDKYLDITYMWNLKYDTNELTYKAETDSQM